MNDQEAKMILGALLERYTVGSILHLISDIYRESADQVRLHDAIRFQKCKQVENALFVVGVGIDSVDPD